MTNYSYMRPQKAVALNKWYENGFYLKDKLSCMAYQNATILPLKKDVCDGLLFGKGGVVYNERFIEESGIEGRVGGYYVYQGNQYRDEKVVYCGALIRHWGHFLIESVARLWYFLEEDLSVDKYVFISNPAQFGRLEEVTGNYREFFELLGIWEKIELLVEPTSFREVLVPELGYSRKYYYSTQYKAVFNQVRINALKQNADRKAESRVFLSRSQLPGISKTEIGLGMLDDYFSRNGFHILYPE